MTYKIECATQRVGYIICKMSPHPATLRFQFLARNNILFQIADITSPIPTPSDIARVNHQYKSKFNVEVRNAKYTNEYNCHGLTFTAKLGWFDSVDALLVAHDFIRIAHIPNLEIDELMPIYPIKAGDVVIYRDGQSVTHSGVVCNMRKRGGKTYLTILSKWGQYSEYFHRHDKVDMDDYGKTLEVWTDREV